SGPPTDRSGNISRLARGVTVARLTLDQVVMVRIHAGQQIPSVVSLAAHATIINPELGDRSVERFRRQDDCVVCVGEKPCKRSQTCRARLAGASGWRPR